MAEGRDGCRSVQDGMPAADKGADGLGDSPCTSCGACCAYSHDWPEFSDEDDLNGIPESMCDCDAGRMKCIGDRCVALVGEIGRKVRCSVYESRPAVCKAFQPGTDACAEVRRWFKLTPATGVLGSASGVGC